jgi:hypothetical protein
VVKKLPKLTTDAEARDFVDHADLSEFDLAGFIPSGEFFARVEAARAQVRAPVHKTRAVKVTTSLEKKVIVKRMAKSRATKSVLKEAIGGTSKRYFLRSKKTLIKAPDRKQKTEAG